MQDFWKKVATVAAAYQDRPSGPWPNRVRAVGAGRSRRAVRRAARARTRRARRPAASDADATSRPL